LRNPSYKPLAVANEFIVMSEGQGVDHMKLQKLTYMAYGWWLAYYDEPFINEAPQVWQHGPVFKSLYHALSMNGWRPIKTVQNDVFVTDAPRANDNDDQVRDLLTWIWGRYGGRSSTWLSEKTHQPGTPWYSTVKSNGQPTKSGLKVPRNLEIPVDVIKHHYEELAQEFGFEQAG
jgi:uncharacterized phage-associated protein